MGNGNSDGGPNWIRIFGIVVAAGAVLGAALIGVRCGRDGGNNNNALPVNAPQEIAYAGRVIDKNTRNPIQGALVEIDSRGQTRNEFTGNNGTFRVLLPSSERSFRIRVSARGYEKFDGPVVPESQDKLEDIRLDPTQPGATLNLPDGTTLRGAINFAAGKNNPPYGVKFVGRCNPKLMATLVRGRDEFQGKDMGDIIDQMKSRLINPPPNASYNVTKLEEGKVYQIECTN